jgi:hypothetical protein
MHVLILDSFPVLGLYKQLKVVNRYSVSAKKEWNIEEHCWNVRKKYYTYCNCCDKFNKKLYEN